MRVKITPAPLCGTVAAPPSKSMAHRYLLAAALADGESTVRGLSSVSEDIAATIDCARTLGAEIRLEGDTAYVRGTDPRTARPRARFLCRESGSTLRFFLPISWLSNSLFCFLGSERLLARPLSVYEAIAKSEGLMLHNDGKSVLAAGSLRGGDYTMRGDVSSQFATGLAYALPFTGRDSRLSFSTPLESRSYLSLTVESLQLFGVAAHFDNDGSLLIPAARFTPADCTVEGDYSGAAFFSALSFLGFPVSVTGLSPKSCQGDRVFSEYFKALKEGTPTLSLADCPDLAPIVMALAAQQNGAHLTHTARLRLKESDRGVVMAAELRKMGARLSVLPDEILIKGGGLTAPHEPLCGHNDHRIVMALATLLLLYGGEITGAEAVAKSLPDYFTLLKSLNARITCYEAL